MSDIEADQFLDIISENVQLKEEIEVIKEYNLIINEFDKELLEICYNKIIEEKINFLKIYKLIKNIKLGIKPIENSESIKKRLLNDRLEKINQTNETSINELINQINKYQEKIENFEKEIEEINNKIFQHNNIIKDEKNIQNKLEKENIKLKNLIENLKKKN